MRGIQAIRGQKRIWGLIMIGWQVLIIIALIAFAVGIISSIVQGQ